LDIFLWNHGNPGATVANYPSSPLG